MSKAKEVTQRMTAHINGGKNSAHFAYDLHYKGVKIAERVSSRGKKGDEAGYKSYLVSVDGAHTLDLIKEKPTPAQLEAWLNQRIEERVL